MALINLAFLVKMPASIIELPRDLHDRAARAAANEIKAGVAANFVQRGGESYWMSAAESVKMLPRAVGEAMVEVRHTGVGLHLRGGIVMPGVGKSSRTGKPTRLLAIPCGRFREAPLGYPVPLAFIPVKGRPHLKGILVPGEKRAAKHKYKNRPAGREIVMPLPLAKAAYHLVDQTTHKPDPTVLPSQKELEAAARLGVTELIDSITFPR